MKIWAVEEVCHYDDDPPMEENGSNALLFENEQDAVDALEKIIRIDWEKFVELEDGTKANLADCRGKHQKLPEGCSVRHAEWGYASNGRFAWVRQGSWSYMGTVEQLEVNIKK